MHLFRKYDTKNRQTSYKSSQFQRLNSTSSDKNLDLTNSSDKNHQYSVSLEDTLNSDETGDLNININLNQSTNVSTNIEKRNQMVNEISQNIFEMQSELKQLIEQKNNKFSESNLNSKSKAKKLQWIIENLILKAEKTESLLCQYNSQNNFNENDSNFLFNKFKNDNKSNPEKMMNDLKLLFKTLNRLKIEICSDKANLEDNKLNFSSSTFNNEKQSYKKNKLESNNPFDNKILKSSNSYDDSYQIMLDDTSNLLCKDEESIQQQQNIENENSNMLELDIQRNESIKAIETDILLVRDIFKDMASLVEDQGFAIDDIESNVCNTQTNVTKAHSDIELANVYQKKSRSKLYMILCVVITILVILILTLVLTLKK